MTVIFDADSHLDEFADMWRNYTTGTERELALRVERDGQGYSWLSLQGHRLMMMDVYAPGVFERAGRAREAHRAGLDIPDDLRYEHQPRDHWDVAARVETMDKWGVTDAVLYPNWGFIWEGVLHRDLDVVRANCAAWNRWAVEVTIQGGNRLHPVGHVTVQGHSRWLESQLAALAAGGVRQAMFSPGLINGLRLSHPDNDPVWRAFLDHGVVPTWHIDSRMTTVFANSEAWYDNDRDSHVQFMPFLVNKVAAQAALADLAINGTFERFPGLNVVIAECGASWFPELLTNVATLDQIMTLNHGRPLTTLKKPAADYIRERTHITCSFPSDVTIGLVEQLPDTFSFGLDYPHPEGVGSFDEYTSRMVRLDGGTAERFFGSNINRFYQ